MDLGLTGRVALVVGGTGYLGTAIADRLAAEGATVLRGSRSGSGDVTLDAADAGSVEKAIAGILEAHGRLDVVVVTAAPAAQTLDASKLADPDAIPEGVAAKSMTFLRVAQAAIPTMRETGFGRVIGISGQNAYLTGNIFGTARNAVLNIAAKSLADELAGSGVTVNTVNPGNVVADPSSQIEKGVPGQSTPEQIAALVAFLASEPAAAVSGEAISTGHKLRGIATL